MWKIIAWTDKSKTELMVKSNEEAKKIRQRVISQMNNGHAVIIGNAVINSTHIRIIDFQFNEVTNDK